jgi:broad specificity phosphatase PhoE
VDERVGIVSHGDFLSALLKALLDGLPVPSARYQLANTGISRFGLNSEGTVVHYVNRVEHLDDARWVNH